MNKTKNIQKRRHRYLLLATGSLLLTIAFLFFLGDDLLVRGEWLKAVKDLIFIGFFGISTWFNFHQARTIGTDKFEDDADDERDEYIDMKTNKVMFSISLNLLMILGAALLIGGAVLGRSVGTDDIRVMVLASVGITLLMLWNLLMIIWFVVYVINYRRN